METAPFFMYMCVKKFSRGGAPGPRRVGQEVMEYGGMKHSAHYFRNCLVEKERKTGMRKTERPRRNGAFKRRKR